MASLQLVRLRRVFESGDVWENEFKPGLNLLIGSENTSKTTTLNIADFCFGNPSNATREFGSTVADEYSEFQLQVRVNGQDHNLTRAVKKYRQTTRVDVDGKSMNSSDFSSWILAELGWPQLFIPKGTSPSSATAEEPLSFRSVFRHIYRNSDSWTNFAYKEWEHYRRAVIAFLLGIAPDIYQGNLVQINQVKLERQSLEAQRLSLRSLLDDFVQQATEGFRSSGITNLDSLDTVEEELTSQINEVIRDRERLIAELRADPQYDTSLDAVLQGMNSEISSALAEVSQISQMLEEQNRLIETLDGDLRRIDRARRATGLLGTLPITMCPACHQTINTSSNGSDDLGVCYLCSQTVKPDLRDRRLDLEARVIANEKTELEDVVTDLRGRMISLNKNIADQQELRSKLLQRIEDERRNFVTPLLREFEEFQFTLGQLNERRQSVLRLSQIDQHVATIDSQLEAVESRLYKLIQQSEHDEFSSRRVRDRCDKLASLMNQFISLLPYERGVFGLVSVNPSTLEFYIGEDQWQAALGDERKVLFFLAYTYSLLALSSDDGVPHPGLAILDNPFQHDAPFEVVEAGLKQFESLCKSIPKLQVIITTRRQLPQIDAHRIQFTNQFNQEI